MARDSQAALVALNRLALARASACWRKPCSPAAPPAKPMQGLVG
jgi:hypothetical protein